MAPTPQNHVPYVGNQLQDVNGDAIVISGMSGLYPRSNNVRELSEILYNKVNPVTHEDLRFESNHPEVVQHTGTLPGLQYFDAQFFKVHYYLSNSMDPMAKKILEQSYQAIYDAEDHRVDVRQGYAESVSFLVAGRFLRQYRKLIFNWITKKNTQHIQPNIHKQLDTCKDKYGVNPEQLSGRKVGVYIGLCFSEAEKVCFYENHDSTFGLAGCSKAMTANRISYWLNAKGPSMTFDVACCSSTTAVENAYLDLKRGECEAAIVGGTFLCMYPQSSVHYSRVIKLCEDGKTKSFDERADGCTKSEAINVLFLQKAKDALRVYAELLHVQNEFTGVLKTENGPKYGFYRDLNRTTNFLKTFYEKAGIPPHIIEYVEAFGCALPEADKVELQAIEEVFCTAKHEPLLVGSVISNIGYGEAASGISAITKVLLGYHTGRLAANLHCEHPRKDIAALCDGRMRIICEHQPFDRTYAAVNGMSVTGVNSHVLLHGRYKPKNLNRYASSIPYLVTISGRHEEAIKQILEDLKSHPVDPEQLALLHNIHRTRISGHLDRGFIIFRTNEEQTTVTVSEKMKNFDDSRRPLWFVYSGMGSQWAGMGTQLLRIPIFAAAIERCRKALERKGLDIVNIITSEEESIFNNVLYSFVGIAAIQIGLTDILHELGLKPDGIIGHSVGELGCAYADGCLTVEEMILSAYYRGLVSLETKLIHGSMAAVGLGHEQTSKLCPPEIVVACHNGPQSSTISGPSDVMREFVATLTANGIFAKEVPCSNIAYHSRYIADAGPGLLKYLGSTINTPKARSGRWLSTSVPKDKWNEQSAKLCSAEYLTNNLLSPVLFDETSQLIPNNAVLVEIAPHGLLQAILKRSMPPSCTNVPLTKRKHPDSAIFLLEAIGQLYLEGYNPNLQVLYPKINMPVSTGTPFLSHLVKWAHGETWPIPRYSSANRKYTANCNFVLSLHDKEHAFLRGHSINGNVLYPFAASLTLVWDVLAMTLDVPKKQLSVVFDNLQLHSQPVLHDRRQLKLHVAIQRGTGYFEILDGSSKVTSGFIRPKQKNIKVSLVHDQEVNMYLNAEDIYQLLRDKDYFYSDEFQSVACVDESLSTAHIVWRDNWTTFIDGMLQLNALRQPHNAVSQATSIRQITIDIRTHYNEILNTKKPQSEILIRAHVSDLYDNTRCGGVVIQNINFQQLPACKDTVMSLKSLNFVSHFNSEIDVASSLEVYLQMVGQNLNKNTITAVGICNQEKEGSMFREINNVLKNMFHIKVNYKQVSRDVALTTYKFEDVDLILVENLSIDEKVQQHFQENLPRNKFIFSEEYEAHLDHASVSSMYRVLAVHGNSKQTSLQLVCWGSVTPTETTTQSVPVHANLTGSHHLLGKWGGEYYVSVNESTKRSQNVTLQGAQFGDYDSMKWVNVPALTEPGVTVNVHYAGINTYDVKKTNSSLLFKQNVNNTYGMDFSGITESGKSVMGIVRSGAASTQVRAQPHLLWPVPAHWSLEEAATVPLAYIQAFYCLGIKVKLPRGKSIFVHGGAGALGQAIISIALALDCEVFTTVSNIHKKHFLQKLFPALKGNHIGCSRDHTFRDMATIALEGKKCDLMISCVKGNLKDITFNCKSFGGIFMDISQIENGDRYNLGMFHFNREGNYMSVDFSSMFEAKSMEDLKTIHKMVSEGITRGYVRPLSHVTYAPYEAARAFRLLAASAHRGRVLLRMTDNTAQAYRRIRCNAKSSNLIICGKTTFGLRFADRLVARGAKRLHLHARTQSSYLQHKIRSWKRLNINVVVSSESLNSQKDVVSLLNNTLMLGPLEGVYIFAEETAIDQSLIGNLDVELRKLSADLRYFAVITFDENSTGKNVCLNRVADQLPATLIMLPEIKEVEYNTFVNWRSVADAVEHALQNTHGVALVHKMKHKPSLLQQIAKLTGLSIPDNAAKSLTLEELGIQNHKLQLLCTFLRVQYNLAIDEEQALSLTINTIMEAEKNLTDLPCEDGKGLSTFFSFVGDDELYASTDHVFMPTLINSSSMRDDEYEQNQISLCIVPGIEGNHDRFRVLCERLKLPAFVLQPGFDNPHETVVEMAQRFAEILLNKIKLKSTFYLLGYESGIIVALEIAAILENHGLSGKVFCIGCTPEELKIELEEQLSPFEDEKQLQEGMLRHMYSLLTGNDFSVLEHELRNFSTWSQKIDTYIRHLLGLVSHSAQYIRSLIECALVRINQMRNYDIALRPLRSQVILLRAAMGHALLQHSALQHVSEQPLVVYQLDSSLAHIATDLRCTSIINEHLDPAILEDFATRNICDTYLLDGSSYVGMK